MSTTGTWAVPSRAFGAALEELRDWRDGIASSLAGFRRWATVSHAMDEQTAARLAYLERRLAGERLTIAFVGEYSRGKTELINALFFADVGTRLLPSGLGRTTLCPTEVAWDPARPPSLRLLPARAVPPARTTTYCVPLYSKVEAGAFTPPSVWNSQSFFPFALSSAVSRPSLRPTKTSPPAVVVEPL